MTKDEMTTLLTAEVKSLSSLLVAADYSGALDDAARDTGWAFPVTGDFKIYWQKDRGKRHLFFYLMSEAAQEFKYEQVNSQHKFEHYKTLVALMDANFIAIQESRPEQFANVDVYKMFGHKIDAGFHYESGTGRDTTYDDDNLVIFNPVA
jgi:molybdopterin-guanine dinucleotide biosynthesis protein A